jgi:glycosyltransferase involved in cell wall biosynthesis
VSSGGLYGAEQVILNLAQSENASSYIGAMYTGHDCALEVVDDAQKRGLRTVVFESQGFGLRAIFEIKRFLRTNRIDILHTHGYKSDIVGWLATLLSKTMWVATNHVWHPINARLRFYEALDAFVLRFAKLVVAVSAHVREDLISASVPASKIRVIHNGIDVDRFREHPPKTPTRAELGLHDEDLIVTIVGRLSPEKGHRTLLTAAQMLCAKFDGDLKFLVVGDGPLRDELGVDVGKMDLDRHVVFTGFRTDMPEIYALTDMLVNVSSIEGLPMTLLEAMAAGVPVVAARTGGIPEIIEHDKTGLLVNANDPKDLAAKLELLIRDEDKRRTLAGSAFQFVIMNHSRERMCDRYRYLYQEAVSEA